DDLAVRGGQSGGLRRGRRARPLFDLPQHVEQHLGRAQIGIGGFVDPLLCCRLAPGVLVPGALDYLVDGLVECRDQECGQILAAWPARVAGLALLKAPADRWLAIADFVIPFPSGHIASTSSWNAARCGCPCDLPSWLLYNTPMRI